MLKKLNFDDKTINTVDVDYNLARGAMSRLKSILNKGNEKKKSSEISTLNINCHWKFPKY
mgnify:CR=1 FL=1